MKKVLWTVIPLILIAVFAAGGLFLRAQTVQTNAQYEQMIQDAQNEQSAAQAELDGVDTSAVDALNTELQAIQAENAAYEESISALNAENESLDAGIAANESTFDAWALDEENAYYLTVYEKLSEGKAKVEGYINNP